MRARFTGFARFTRFTRFTIDAAVRSTILTVLLAAPAARAQVALPPTGSPSSMDPPPFTGEMPPPPPLNDHPRDFGFVLALRSGYAIPFGRTASDMGADLGQVFSGAVPIAVSLAVRSGAYFQLGGGVQFAPIFASGAASGPCAEALGHSCTAWDLRLTLEAEAHLRSRARWDPWVGLGFGYEILHVDARDAGSQGGGAGVTSTELRGSEFVHIDVGVDVLVHGGMRVGPVLDFTVGQFDRLDFTQSNQPASEQFSNKALHEWFMLGLRARYAL